MPVRIPDLDWCLKKLQASSDVRQKLIAVAFKDNGHVITSATNRTIRGHHHKFTTHAEENLVSKMTKIAAYQRFKKIYVLVARWTKTKGWCLAEPCERCGKLLQTYGVTGVYFTDEVGSIQFEGVKK